jgi:hypothetical protein
MCDLRVNVIKTRIKELVFASGHKYQVKAGVLGELKLMK